MLLNRAKKWRQGALDRQSPGDSSARKIRRVASIVWPDGPSTAEEVADWPGDILRRSLGTSDDRVEERMRKFFDGTEIQLTTDYSGMDCPSEALRLVVASLRRSFPSWEVRDIRLLRSCDCDPVCQRVLKANQAADGNFGVSCLFEDLLGRLDDAARAEVRRLEPLPGSAPYHAAKCRQRQTSYIYSRKQELFTKASKPQCVIHGRSCMTLPTPPPLRPGLALRMHIAGVCCQGWSSVGPRLKHAHKSELPHAVWTAERYRAAELNLEHLFVQECTAKYHWEEKLSLLKETHELRRLIVGPEMLGIPCRRPRSFVIGVNRNMMRWEGPQQDDVQRHFESIYRRRMVADGAAFMNASDEDIATEMQRLASIQKHFWPEEMDVSASIKEAVESEEAKNGLLMEVLGAAFRRYEEAEEVRAASQAGVFFSDTDQSLGFSVASPLIPCEVRHGTIVAHHAARVLTPGELMSAHGFHIFEGASGQWGLSPRTSVFASLTTTERSQLAGNGMNLPVLAAIVEYAAGHVGTVDACVPEVKLGFGCGATSFFDAWAVSDDDKAPDSGPPTWSASSAAA